MKEIDALLEVTPVLINTFREVRRRHCPVCGYVQETHAWMILDRERHYCRRNGALSIVLWDAA